MDLNLNCEFKSITNQNSENGTPSNLPWSKHEQFYTITFELPKSNIPNLRTKSRQPELLHTYLKGGPEFEL